MSNVGTRLLKLTSLGLLGLLTLHMGEWSSLLLSSEQGIRTAAASDELAVGIARSISAYRDRAPSIPDIITGASDTPPTANSADTKKTDEKASNTKEVISDTAAPESPEKTILERLSARRMELDRRDKELSEREALLAAAEKQIEGRMSELKSLDEAIKTDMARKDADQVTLKPLIIMYEAMKPKEAARIIEKLDLKSVLPIASAMNPKKLSEILAQLDPVIAGKLTVGLAAGTSTQVTGQNDKSDLPELPDAPVTKIR
jgi:flagellar motility protein MotE (MotC chaperone)